MFWTTKQKRETNHHVSVVETCAVCKHQCEHEIIGVQNYFTLYGLAFFPTSKSLFRACQNCKYVKEIKLKKIPSALDSYNVEHLFSNKKRWRYYSGFYVIGMLALLILYFILKYEII